MDPDNTCPVCHEIVSVYAIGQCDHPICFKCSTRMRVLCEQMYCAICRSDLPEVLFVTRLERYVAVDRRNFISNKRYKILFHNFNCEETYNQLQEHRCKICKDRPVDKSFYALKDHMRREHTMFCCDLCFQHLKIFSFQRKFYNRSDLVKHRRTGDKDDKSYKGHPLCHFCDERYMDNDELLRHLRKDHYFCHFCDEGSNDYYSDYENLQQHFKSRHYLCEIDHCINVQFTNAFRSTIDLKAHIAKEHHQGMNKAQAKETRTLDVNFKLPPRARGRARGGPGVTSEDYEDTDGAHGRPYHGRGYSGQDYGREQRHEREQVERAHEASLQEALRMSEREMKELERRRHKAQEEEERKQEEERLRKEVASLEKDFPSLAGASSVPALVPAGLGKTSKKAHKDVKPQKVVPMTAKMSVVHRMNSADYPSLGNSTSSSGPHRSSHSGRESPFNNESSNAIQTPAVHASNIQTIPQSVLDSLKKEDSGVRKHVPKRSGEEFPMLGGRPQRSKNDGNVSLMSLGVWSGKSKKNEPQQDNTGITVSDKSQHSVSTSLASIGLAVYNGDRSAGNKPTSSPTPSFSQSRITSSAKSKSIRDSNKLQNGSKVKEPPPKTRDKPAPTCDDKEEIGDLQVKKNKKKKKSKGIDVVKNEIPTSTGPGKEGKTKEEKSADPVAKLFNEANDRDSGIESSSGSIDAGSVPPFKTEELAKLSQTNTVSVSESTPAPMPTATSNCMPSNSESAKSSLDCIAVKLLGIKEEKLPELADFPALNPPSVMSPPPGFKPTTPPGFCGKSSKSKPQSSGSSSKPQSSGSSSMPPPGFTPQSTPINPDSSNKKKPAMFTQMENVLYSKPRNFNERNKELVQTVSDYLNNDQEKFGKFKTYSGGFRQGSLDAAGYYQSCQELLGQEKFDLVLPELIALLPDIIKQQELLNVHKESPKTKTSKSAVLKISGKPTKAPWSNATDFKSCPSCGQVLMHRDFDLHVSEHNRSDYPSLGSRGPQPGFLGQGSWIKAK